MTTKTPSAVRPAPDQTLETIAYACAAGIPTAEPHGQDRLGFSLFLWIKGRRDPLETAVRAAGVRFLIKEEEALRRIKDALKNHGVSL
jgi:hypothetical protein